MEVSDGGSLVTAISIDASDVGAVRLPNDSQKLMIGANDDLRIQHNGSHSFIQQYGTGDLYIDNNNDDKSIIFRTDDGSGGVTPYLKLDGSATNVITHQQFCFEDTNAVINRVSNDLEIRTYGGNDINLMAAGNVGIGTTSPSHELVVRKDHSAATELSIVNLTSNSNAATNLRFRNATSSSETGNGALIQLQNGNTFRIINQFGNPLILGTSNTERMRIDGSGNVGIGTNSPDTLLHIDEDDAAIAFKVTGGSGGSKIAQFVRDVGVASPYAETYIHASSGDPQITFRDAGNQYYSIGLDDSGNSFKISEHSAVGTNDRLEIDTEGNLKIFDNGTNPTASANNAFLFCDSGELKVLDELGNTTTISPHNFDLIPGGASEDRAWGYYSEKDIKDEEGNVTSTQKVNVDMMKLARLVEQLTGEKLVYTEEDE